MFAWLFLPLVALFNIFLRDGVIIPLVGPELAVPISTVTLLIMLYATAYFLLTGVERPTSCRISLLLGVIWVGFAIIFQALFVMFALGKPLRSEERRVGKGCSEPCRSQWSREQ